MSPAVTSAIMLVIALAIAVGSRRVGEWLADRDNERDAK